MHLITVVLVSVLSCVSGKSSIQSLVYQILEKIWLKICCFFSFYFSQFSLCVVTVSKILDLQNLSFCLFRQINTNGALFWGKIAAFWSRVENDILHFLNNYVYVKTPKIGTLGETRYFQLRSNCSNWGKGNKTGRIKTARYLPKISTTWLRVIIISRKRL